MHTETDHKDEMTMNSTESGARFTAVRESAGALGGALSAGGRAYFSGLSALGRAMIGFGRETASETGAHMRATLRAKNMREMASLQAAYAQRRIELSATHAKEFVDLAQMKSGEVIEPFAGLLKPGRDAA